MTDEQFLQSIPRYGIGGFVGKIFKKVKDTVKKVAPIAGAGIGFMLGGSAGAGIGSGIGSLIAGKSVSESLKNAALGYGIGSIAGRFGPLQRFAGEGIGGRFAFGDDFNVLNKLMPRAAETLTTESGGTTPLKYLVDNGIEENAAKKILENPEMEKLVTKKIIEGTGKETAKKAGSLLSKAATGLTVAAPIMTYLEAKKAEEDFVPGDPYALNPFYYSDPQQFQVSNLGVKPYYMDDMQNYFGIPREDLPSDFIRAKDGGGIMKLANGSDMKFPRKTGAINGPGTGTSDDIPAMLSDGEFVFTAKAVRNAGGGDRRAGAKRMYQMMKNLEKGGTLSPQSRGVAA